MARIISIFLALFIASASIAAPLERRQVQVSAACNEDRINILTAVLESDAAVDKIDTSDDATATAVGAAKLGLSSAGTGVKAILSAIIDGVNPPASGQTSVELGLNTTRFALAGITNPAVNSTVAAAQAAVQTAIGAANDIIRDCN
ncbi:hypothetical protein DFH07DRAFT_936712 [Mycena maculata]|uniref:Uncharacterized protein n=1 Tax=Mycena maculata TaxID=230809 RepID=A0AAD7K413_9AGAR|nr:hypothetical protein DFH07DRAFT_936712 [Mycena maculata]